MITSVKHSFSKKQCLHKNEQTGLNEAFNLQYNEYKLPDVFLHVFPCPVSQTIG